MESREWLNAYTSVTTGLVLLGAVVLSYAASTLQQYYRLRNFKGPWSAGFSSWWHVRSVAGGRAYLDYWEVTQRYGQCLARLGASDD